MSSFILDNYTHVQNIILDIVIIMQREENRRVRRHEIKPITTNGMSYDLKFGRYRFRVSNDGVIHCIVLNECGIINDEYYLYLCVQKREILLWIFQMSNCGKHTTIETMVIICVIFFDILCFLWIFGSYFFNLN